jgi:putative heme iron utilization protein
LKNIYDDATETKQDFLLIDLEGDKDSRFRKGFNEIYVIEEEKI